MLWPQHPLQGKQNRWSFDTSGEAAHPEESGIIVNALRTVLTEPTGRECFFKWPIMKTQHMCVCVCGREGFCYGGCVCLTSGLFGLGVNDKDRSHRLQHRQMTARFKDSFMQPINAPTFPSRWIWFIFAGHLFLEVITEWSSPSCIFSLQVIIWKANNTTFKRKNLNFKMSLN